MIKKIIYISLLFSFCFLHYGCTKKLKEPFNLYGFWIEVEGDSYCSGMFLDIKKNGNSTYGTLSGDKGCSGKHWIGKARIIEQTLYIGGTKLKIVEKATLIENPQPIGHPKKRTPVIPTLQIKVKNGALHGRHTYKFFKIEDY